MCLARRRLPPIQGTMGDAAGRPPSSFFISLKSRTGIVILRVRGGCRSVAFWAGALGPEDVQGPAARALDVQSNKNCHCQLLAAVTTSDFFRFLHVGIAL